ncbi:hypothetical protein HQN90_05220 [Paenibacillus alba]|uniref:hypothetical protein n=1 Tax=Paenibacillus alba TaxID=1197127 RepID=UPI0015669E2C|nr:hypothetical protein [Paenibacillus alba]NQX65523.1 hypothetical protein [Paenibacillus alba]
MSNNDIDNISAFATLHRYMQLSQSSKPTVEQAEAAIVCLCQVYGVNNEFELLSRGDKELIEHYNEIKKRIMYFAL